MNTNTSKRINILAALLSITLLGGGASAQDAQSSSSSEPSVRSEQARSAVTASVTGGIARFAAPGEVIQIRLEIYSASGELVYDSGARHGGIFDWKGTDAQQQALADGSYVCAVTVKDLSGRQTRKVGSLSLSGGAVSLGSAVDVNAAQSRALKATAQARKLDAGDGAITVLRDGKERAVTLTAHDGNDGQVTSTKGSLTFRTGDTLAGTDAERVRITPEGRVGVGTDAPEATLDVAGTVRARGGIVFGDGTVLTSASDLGSVTKNVAVATTSGDAPTASATGSGTTGKLARWMDGAGTLGNGSIFDNGTGNIGLGKIADAGVRLDILSPAGTVPFKFTQNALASANPTLALFATNDGTLGQYAATTHNGDVSFVMGATAARNFGIFANNSFNAPQLFIKNNGNVGVGTTNPNSRLDVAGSLRISGAGSALIFPDGSSMTTAPGGSGSTPSGTSIVTAINDPVTAALINDNRLSPNVARLGGANAWSGSNVFGAGLSANNSLITNVGNPVNAGDAVNKAYADANFVKFVPGAEQLSVGDANGTAPMINLRGGSTCCSGPGGHTPAWFKVFQNGSFVATGNLGIGVSPMQGKGYRTSWDSYKGAFRSGYADNEWDDANVGFFSWAGGSNSTAIGLYALAFGDTNSAESTSSIVFGSGNQVKGAAGFSAGAGNRVCDTYGVAFGNRAISGSPILADGKCDPDTFNIRGLAAVAIGYNVTASMDHTTAMGKFASNNGFTGTFVWSDGSATQSADTFRNTANNEFAARATGGFRFRTNLGGTTGCNLPAGSGVFNCTSSRTTKENFFDVNGDDVLARLRKVPVSTWNYISEGTSARHLGPMAEDFYSAFGLGTSDKAIGVQDAVGVSLAAVKALDARTLELQQKTEEVEELRAKVNTLEQRLAALEQKLLQSAESAPRK